MKLYRFRDAEWKERALGDMTICKRSDRNDVICLVRQEKTLKIKCNFRIYPQEEEHYCKLEYQGGNKKTVMFVCSDNSEDDGPVVDRFAMKVP